MAMRDGTIVCDQCSATITRVTETTQDGWVHMHNLCSKCFAEGMAKAA
jgi:hypothetical protein